MTEQLAPPLLVTAFCRFDFEDEPGEEWDWTIPGSLFENLKSKYPEKRQVFGYQPEAVEARAPEALNLDRVPMAVELANDEQTRLIRVGPAFLEIRQNETYTGWKLFEKQILRIFSRHQEIAEAPDVTGIGLRYINRLELREAMDSLDETITLLPNLEGNLDRPLRNFYQQYTVEWTEPAGRLIHRTGTPEPNEQHQVMVDLEFRSDDIGDANDDSEITRWLRGAHAAVYHTFRDSLQDELFDRLRTGEAN